MSDSRSRNRLVAWVAFALCVIFLVCAIFVSWRAGRDQHQETQRRNKIVSELKFIDERLQALRAMANDKHQLRADEANVIRSMLGPVQSIEDMDFDLDCFVWRHKEQWMGEEDGAFSVIFYTPRGTGRHRLVATTHQVDSDYRKLRKSIALPFPQFGLVPLVPMTDGLQMEPRDARLECELESGSVYEFRISQLEKSEQALRLRMELFDKAGVSLAEQELRLDEHYTSGYSRGAPQRAFAFSNEVTSYDVFKMAEGQEPVSQPGVELLRLTLPFVSNTREALQIRCVAVSEGAKVVDPIDLIRRGWATKELLEALSVNSQGNLDVSEFSKSPD